MSRLITDSSTTYANPNGTLTTDESLLPFQAKDASGNWKPLNETLVASGGVVAPRLSATGAQFSAGGSGKAAARLRGERNAGFGWHGDLPSPRLSGATATYPNVYAGTDLTQTATATGYESSLVVSNKAAADALPDTVSFPLSGTGITWSVNAQQVLLGKDSTGAVVATSSGAEAYDASRDAAGDPADTAPLTISVTGAAGAQSLVMSTPRAFLDDPATAFPVTIDPSLSLTRQDAGYISSGAPSTAYYNKFFANNSEWPLGRNSSTNYVYRLLFQFDTSSIAGKDVLSATLSLGESYSTSCSAAGFSVFTGPVFGPNTTWNNIGATSNPSYTTTKSVGYDIANSPCPAGQIATDFTAWARNAAAGGSNTVELISSNEASSAAWHKFMSAGFSVTYDSYPTAPAVGVEPIASSPNGTLLTDTTTPQLWAEGNDPDAGDTETLNYRVFDASSGVQVTSGSTTAPANTTTYWVPPSGKMLDGNSYYFSVVATDQNGLSSPTGTTGAFTVDTTAPPAPTVGSSDHPAGQWSPGTTGHFSFSSGSYDVSDYSYSEDGGTWSAWSSQGYMTWSGMTDTFHSLSVRAEDYAGNVSPVTTYSFGGGLSSPRDQDQTSSDVPLVAMGPSGYPYATYQWRWGTSGTWITIPSSDIDAVNDSSTHPSFPTADGSANQWLWHAVQTVRNAGHSSDGVIQVQACFSTSPTDPSPVCQGQPVTISVDMHAFGASYATQEIGPGEVSLESGDYEVSTTDVSVPTYAGTLSFSRTATTLRPTGDVGGINGVFGPGWTASFDGLDDGSGQMTLSDNSTTGGYVTLTDSDGSASEYQPVSALTSYPITFTGMGDAGDGSVLTKDSANQFTLTAVDGTRTVWTASGSSWQVTSVTEPGSISSSYSYYTTTGTGPCADSRWVGLICRILGPVPAGVSGCATAPDTTPGCRSLTFSYETVASTHTRLASVSLSAPQAAGTGDSVELAAYSYDSSGMLIGEDNPQTATGNPAHYLTTGYSYDSNNRLASMTPPGQTPWTFGYDSTGCAVSPLPTTCGRLLTVSRASDSADGPSGTATTTVIYGVPYTGSSAPIDLGSTQTASWGQTADLPMTATAVFAPDHQPAGTTPATVTSSDWPYATISYIDVSGRAVNTATYGAGAWQIDTAQYDQKGHVIWSLTSGNRAQALNPTSSTDPAAAALSEASPANTAAAANLLATQNSYDTDPVAGGTELVDTLGPIHPVTITTGLSKGSVIDGRDETQNAYDCAQLPNGTGGDCDYRGLYRLVTDSETSVRAQDSTQYDLRYTHIRYDGSTSGGVSDWQLREPNYTIDPGGLETAWIYSDSGQVTQQWQPSVGGSGDTAHPGGDDSTERETWNIYYSAGGSGTCINDAWAGMLCQSKPGEGTPDSLNLPTTTYTYDVLGDVLTEAESFGSSGTTRTTTNTYDAAGRETSSSITVTPTAAGGTSVPTTYDCYDPATGLQTGTSTVSASCPAGPGTLTTVYDSQGRTESYTDASGTESSTTYDLDGRTVSVNDGKGTTTYSYDNGGGTSASEHRGLVTGEDVGVSGSGSPSTFAVSYDADGNPTSTTYPNGVTASRVFDNAGQLTNLTYAAVQWGSATEEFSQHYDELGQVVGQASPGSAQAFAYDGSGRLTTVQDTSPPPNTGTSTCTTRVYTFDNDSNRTSLASYPDGTGGSATGDCTTSTSPTTTSYVYDQADRLVSDSAGTYTYDTLGRATSVPAGDATGIGIYAGTSGGLTVGYYTNDLVASQAQGSETLSFALDPDQDRFLSASDSNSGLTTTNHYSDDSDSPTWTSGSDGTWTRNLLGPDGALAGIIDNAGTVTLDLTNPHGDVVGQMADSTSSPSLLSYSESTEYGAPRSASAAYGTYGWIGSKRRSSDDLAGLVLMGVRLYNPATGRFLSTDPLPGGNANPYNYPDDPITEFDTSGQYLPAPDSGGPAVNESRSGGGKGGGDRGRGPSLTQEEEDAIYKKEHGQKYDKKTYKRAIGKQTTDEKYKDERNKGKQRGGGKNYSVGATVGKVVTTVGAVAVAVGGAAAAASRVVGPILESLP